MSQGCSRGILDKNIPKKHLTQLTANKFNLHGIKVDALRLVPECFLGLIRLGIKTFEVCQTSDLLMEANIWEMVSRRNSSKETRNVLKVPNNVWRIFKYVLVVCDVFQEVNGIRFTEWKVGGTFHSFEVELRENFFKSKVNSIEKWNHSSDAKKTIFHAFPSQKLLNLHNNRHSLRQNFFKLSPFSIETLMIGHWRFISGSALPRCLSKN